MPTAITQPLDLFKDAPSVESTINYLDRSVTKPFLWVTPDDRPAGEPIHNQISTPATVSITDLKNIDSSELERAGFNTKEAGFQFVEGFGKKQTLEDWEKEKWSDEDWLKENYYRDVDQLLKKELGVDRTYIFDHTVRKRRVKEGEPITRSSDGLLSIEPSTKLTLLQLHKSFYADEHKPDDPSNRTPVPFAHSDQSRKAGEDRILKHLGQETLDKVKKGQLHVQIINVWRPLRGPVKETPLAVADSRTVSPGGDGKEPDWRESELRYKDWTGETLAVSRLHFAKERSFALRSGRPISRFKPRSPSNFLLYSLFLHDASFHFPFRSIILHLIDGITIPTSQLPKLSF